MHHDGGRLRDAMRRNVCSESLMAQYNELNCWRLKGLVGREAAGRGPGDAVVGVPFAVGCENGLACWRSSKVSR